MTEHVREQVRTDRKPERKMKTRCYYTEYVNHMIRFYLTCPDMLTLDGKRRPDIDNWVSVQAVLHALPQADREKVLTIYKRHFNLPTAVGLYCAESGADERETWVLLTKTASMIAKQRGLV